MDAFDTMLWTLAIFLLGIAVASRLTGGSSSATDARREAKDFYEAQKEAEARRREEHKELMAHIDLLATKREEHKELLARIDLLEAKVEGLAEKPPR